MDDGKPLAAKDNPKTIGKGYEYPESVSMQDGPFFLKDIAKISGIDGLRFIN